MANFTFNVKNTNKKNKSSVKSSTPKETSNRIYVKCYDEVKEIPSYYTYIDENGEEKKFTDKSYNIFKVGTNKFVARKNSVEKIPLEYIQEKPTIQSQNGYFQDENGKEYQGKIFFDEENNTYFGIKKNMNLYHQKVELYEE